MASRNKAAELSGERFEDRERRELWYSQVDIGGGASGNQAIGALSDRLRGVISEGLREKGGGYGNG